MQSGGRNNLFHFMKGLILTFTFHCCRVGGFTQCMKLHPGLFPPKTNSKDPSKIDGLASMKHFLFEMVPFFGGHSFIF